MSFFSKKPEVKLKEFCRNVYDETFINPPIGKEHPRAVFPDQLKQVLIEEDPDFKKVELSILANEILTLRFELFALAWIHEFGLGSAIDQSLFTKLYLKDKGKIDVWNGMDHYNKAVSHASIVGISDIQKASILKTRADNADKFFLIANKKGIAVDEAIGWAINRFSSEKAWKERKTAYFLMLSLCHKLGLGFGSNYHGPKEGAQGNIIGLIFGCYAVSKKSWGEVKIVS
jgi:hypothetical protein